MLQDKRIVIAAGLRLPQAKAGGAFMKEDAAHMGTAVCRELLARLVAPGPASGLVPQSWVPASAGATGTTNRVASAIRIATRARSATQSMRGAGNIDCC